MHRIFLTKYAANSYLAMRITFMNELAKIFNAMGIDTNDVPAMSHPVPMTNVFREDVLGASLTAEQALAGAPAVEDERFRVPRILDEE